MIDFTKIQHYNDSNYKRLLRPTPTEDGRPQALPRRTKYGSAEATQHGLVPYGESIKEQDLIEEKDFKEIIERCHAKKIFPMYYEERAGVSHWNQNGLGLCWAWGCTGSLIACRSNMALDPVLLAPNTLGWLVGWKNSGWYLDSTIKGAREKGIAPQSCVPSLYSLKPSTFAEDWEDQALNYRTGEWWDGDTSQGDLFTIRQCLTMLAEGVALYVALDWWMHALQIVGYAWDTSQPHNVLPYYWNSHDDDIITIAGSRGVPDEFYGMRTGSLPG